MEQNLSASILAFTSALELEPNNNQLREALRYILFSRVQNCVSMLFIAQVYSVVISVKFFGQLFIVYLHNMCTLIYVFCSSFWVYIWSNFVWLSWKPFFLLEFIMIVCFSLSTAPFHHSWDCALNNRLFR